MRYISTDKMIAFLEKEKAEHIIGGDYSDGVLDTCDNILAFINSFQQKQPEVDLNKEIEDYCGTYENRPVPDFIETVAKHFYELGLNARKED